MPRRRKNPVSLSPEDRGRLESLIAHGHAPARELTHARILLKADEGEEATGEAFAGDHPQVLGNGGSRRPTAVDNQVTSTSKG